MEDLSNYWLVLYIVVWLCTFVHYYKKTKYIGAGGLMIIFFIVYAASSLALYNDSFWGARFKPMQLFPFVFLYLMTMLSITPIIKWDRMRISSIIMPNEKILLLILWFFILSTFLRLTDGIPNLLQGVSSMVLDASAGYEQYIDTMEESQISLGDGIIKNIFAIFSNLLFDFATLFVFYFLAHREGIKYKSIIILTFICLLICIILPIAASQRGPVLEHVLVLLITYFAFKKFINSKIKRIINTILCSAISLISLPIAVITISRFDSRGVFGSIYNYFGQENLYFNNYAFDNNGLRYGDRIFPLFKKMLGFNNVPSSFWERRENYPNLHINDEVFIGYVGDFLLDFGPIISLIIFIIYSNYVNININKVQNSSIYLYNLLPLMFLMHVCVFGSMFLFPFADDGNLTIIMYILMFVFLKIISRLYGTKVSFVYGNNSSKG